MGDQEDPADFAGVKLRGRGALLSQSQTAKEDWVDAFLGRSQG